MEYFSIFMEDLKPGTQKKLIEFLGDDEGYGNHPIVTIEKEAICDRCKYKDGCGSEDRIEHCLGFEFCPEWEGFL